MNKKQMIKEQKRIKKEQKETQYLFNNESDVYKNLIRITIGVIVFIGLVFCFTNIAKGNWNLFNKENIAKESIDEKMVMVGTMFNKSEEEYLVLAYDMDDINENDYYSFLTDNYNDTKKLYYLDLSSGFNQKFIGDKNIMSSDLTKFKISGPTLMVVKGDKIVKSYDDEKSITEYFQK